MANDKSLGASEILTSLVELSCRLGGLSFSSGKNPVYEPATVRAIGVNPETALVPLTYPSRNVNSKLP